MIDQVTDILCTNLQPIRCTIFPKCAPRRVGSAHTLCVCRLGGNGHTIVHRSVSWKETAVYILDASAYFPPPPSVRTGHLPQRMEALDGADTVT